MTKRCTGSGTTQVLWGSEEHNRKFSGSPPPHAEDLSSTWIWHPDAPTTTADLACLTNAALDPKTPKLLPHVETDPKLQAISTASVRLRKDNQEKGGLKELFWSTWKIDKFCAW